MESSRKQQVQADLGLTTQEELVQMESAIEKEKQRLEKKEEKRRILETESSYRMLKGIATVMDKYFVDPIVGFFLPGFGDTLTSVLTLPFIYVSLCKIRSIPLTLAVIYNMLIDNLLGMIPFCIGDLIDAFNRSYKKNFRLIVGFVEDDKEVIREVNNKALRTAILIVVICLLIYWLVQLVMSLASYLWSLGSDLWNYILGLFA